MSCHAARRPSRRGKVIAVSNRIERPVVARTFQGLENRGIVEAVRTPRAVDRGTRDAAVAAGCTLPPVAAIGGVGDAWTIGVATGVGALDALAVGAS